MKSLALRSIFILFVMLSITACDNRLSVGELADQVKNHMEGEGGQYKEKNININSLILVREGKDSNKYDGIMKTEEPNGKFTYTVKVVYDGVSFTWEAKPVQ